MWLAVLFCKQLISVKSIYNCEDWRAGQCLSLVVVVEVWRICLRSLF